MTTPISMEQVFCNRTLNMESIKAIGFDLDYTLVPYKLFQYELLIYKDTLNRLVANNYPSAILEWELDQTSMIRGLIIDKKRGNILKLDRHHYVKKAYHGFKELSQKERNTLYDVEKITSYKEPDFSFLDSFFQLTEGFLISKLVWYKDTQGALPKKSYYDLCNDIRTALDVSHRDDNLKNIISSNPEKYILRDPNLPNLLLSLKSMGKKLFILTNAIWNYLNPVMSYLLPFDATKNIHWMDYFDFIMTGAQKPQFFSSKNLMFEVDPSNGFLKNLRSVPVLPNVPSHALPKIFQGGHAKQLHQMMSISRGSEVLYVGDHIYGDVVRSKKNCGWRTMLLIAELEDELKLKLHPIWGALMKTGNHNSFFSAQVSYYACLYTARVTNLRHYNKHKKFEAMPDVLPHDILQA